MEQSPPPSADTVVYPDWIPMLLWAAVAIAAIWLVLTIFVAMRRNASNLTSVHEEKAKASAAPDFLTVDHKAREAAMARGQAFEQKLTEREAAEAAGRPHHRPQPEEKGVGVMQRLASIATILFSVFSLVGTLLGVITQVKRMNEEFGRADLVVMVMQKYPIPFIVCIFVIGYHIYLFVSKKKWNEPPKTEAPKV